MTIITTMILKSSKDEDTRAFNDKLLKLSLRLFFNSYTSFLSTLNDAEVVLRYLKLFINCKKMLCTEAFDSDALKDTLKIAIGYLHFSKDNLIKETDFRIVSLERFESDLKDMLKEVRIDPGDYISLDIPEDNKKEVENKFYGLSLSNYNCIIFYLPDSSSEEVEQKQIIFNLEINFKQFN